MGPKAFASTMICGCDMRNIRLSELDPFANELFPQIRDALVDIFERVARESAKNACSFACSCKFLNETFKEPSVIRVLNLSAFVQKPSLMKQYPMFLEAAISAGNPTSLYLRGMTKITVDNDIEGSVTFFSKASKAGVDTATLMLAICGTAYGLYEGGLVILDRIVGWKSRMEYMEGIANQVMDLIEACKEPTVHGIFPNPFFEFPICRFKHQMICEHCYLAAMSSLPDRLFALGNEPENKKVNTYFQLNYIDTITCALEEDHLEKLSSSQFGKIIETGNKIASSVRFLHFMLSRQLVTAKKKELWCLFAGQPIRFSIREFAIATSLDCSKLPPQRELNEKKLSKQTKKLFGSSANATPGWIASTLSGRPYKDKETRYKLACLLLIDGVLCPTSRNARISGDHILMVKDFHNFLEYPWRRKSFDLTMDCIRSKTDTPSNFLQPTCAFQSFLHALQMVILECAPTILVKDVKGKGKSVGDDEDEEDESPLIRPGGAKPVKVKAILPDDENLLAETELGIDDDVSDERVDNLLAAISRGDKFTRKSWIGSLHKKQEKTQASSSRSTPCEGPLKDSDSSEILDKLDVSHSLILQELKNLREDFGNLRSEVSTALSNFKLAISDIQGHKPKETTTGEPKKISATEQAKKYSTGELKKSMPTKSTPPIRIQPKKSTHVRFAQISSSSEETKSSESKEIAAKGNPSDSGDSDSDNGIDSYVGEENVEEEVNLDGEGIGNGGQNDDDADQAKSLMEMGGSSALDQATIAHNQIASVLSDLAKDPYEAYTTVPSTATNSGIPFTDQVFVADDQIRDVNPSPAKSEKTLEDRAIVNEHLKAVVEPPIPAQTSSELPQQGKVTDVVKPVTNSKIPEEVEPPVWSLGLTQEEKNMVEANKIPSEEPQPVRKSKRVAQPSTAMSDYVVPRPKRS
ncbi:hypothetical protein EUTSA_v10003015mg [Eutrema salsugineum]|uniref:DUF1985 domain-containing protein n=1 Tax=Eutrema salsugineum TaxID=72664 RepID=V4KIA8_EUTSA|nr:hypothetical protein EUTSA_v10003015mg [Eutrema salsugineum]